MRVPLAIVALLVPSVAHGFEQLTTNGNVPLAWSDTDIQVQVGARIYEDSEFGAAVRRAADAWTHASHPSVRLVYGGPGAPPPGEDGVTGVSLEDPWMGDEDAIAHTALIYDSDTGVIREADLSLNVERYMFAEAPGAVDPQSVVLHEFGHLLGLAHSCGDPGTSRPSCFNLPPEDRPLLSAVMAPTLAPGANSRTLADDDRAGIAAIYGPPVPREFSIAGFAYSCDRSSWRLHVEALPDMFEVEVRRRDGTTVPVDAALEAADTLVFDTVADGDLIVRDRGTGAYDALVEIPEPDACPMPPPPEDAGGCSCASPADRLRPSLWGILFFPLMLLRGRRLASALALTVAILASPAALAFKCSRVGPTSGPSLSWNARVIPWYVSADLFDVYGDPTSGEEDVRESFMAWEAVDCSDMVFPFAAVVTGLRAEFFEDGSNRNAVVAVAVGWPYDAGAIALTTSAYDTMTGEVVDSDIELNAEHFQFARVDDMCDRDSGTMDLRNTLTHEVGHVIGLEHPPNAARYRETTMFASAPSCETNKRTLEADDVAGICAIYPTGEPTQPCYPPDGPNFAVINSDDGFGGCTTGTGRSPSLWLLAALLWLRRRRS